jgi:hypothetical protein
MTPFKDAHVAAPRVSKPAGRGCTILTGTGSCKLAIHAPPEASRPPHLSRSLHYSASCPFDDRRRRVDAPLKHEQRSSAPLVRLRRGIIVGGQTQGSPCGQIVRDYAWRPSSKKRTLTRRIWLAGRGVPVAGVTVATTATLPVGDLLVLSARFPAALSATVTSSGPPSAPSIV